MADDAPQVASEFHVAAQALLARQHPAEAIAQLLAKQAEMEAQLNAAQKDHLTGLNGRQLGLTELNTLMARGKREEQPIAIIIFDVDHFKKINDTYGHPGGDAVLKTVGDIVRHTIREDEVRMRWGGEEFVVAVESPMESTAGAIAQRLRTALEKSEVDFGGQKIKFTASFGVTLIEPNETAEQAIARADAALYRAKESGRNRVMLSRAPSLPQSPPSALPPSSAAPR